MNKIFYLISYVLFFVTSSCSGMLSLSDDIISDIQRHLLSTVLVTIKYKPSGSADTARSLISSDVRTEGMNAVHAIINLSSSCSRLATLFKNRLQKEIHHILAQDTIYAPAKQLIYHIQRAIGKSTPHLAELFILSGIDLNYFDKNMTASTALISIFKPGTKQWSFTANDPELTQAVSQFLPLLLKAGANPNQVGAAGYTPLHLAACYGNTKAIDILLEYKADKTIKNNDGKVPYDELIKLEKAYDMIPNEKNAALQIFADLKTKLAVATV